MAPKSTASSVAKPQESPLEDVLWLNLNSFKVGELQALLEKRGVRVTKSEEQKHKYVQQLVAKAHEEYEAQNPSNIFNNQNDPDGKREEAHLGNLIGREERGIRLIKEAVLEYHEYMKKREATFYKNFAETARLKYLRAKDEVRKRVEEEEARKAALKKGNALQLRTPSSINIGSPKAGNQVKGSREQAKEQLGSGAPAGVPGAKQVHAKSSSTPMKVASNAKQAPNVPAPSRATPGPSPLKTANPSSNGSGGGTNISESATQGSALGTKRQASPIYSRPASVNKKPRVSTATIDGKEVTIIDLDSD